MINEVDSFYRKVLGEIIREKTAKILVCGGDITDKAVFADLGYQNVIISGMDKREYDYTPYVWVEENVESLSFPDDSFDYSVIHAAIHHTHLPHKVLTELYRVSKKGLLAFEGRDSLLIRIATRFGLTQEYEVAGNYPGMGVNGTDIPNFIYRWSEREIKKTIKSFSPFFKHRFIFKYGTAYPHGPDLSRLKKILLRLMRPFFYIIIVVFPKQQNQFAFFVEKPQIPHALLPWLIYNEEKQKIEPDNVWINQYYVKERKRRK